MQQRQHQVALGPRHRLQRRALVGRKQDPAVARSGQPVVEKRDRQAAGRHAVERRSGHEQQVFAMYAHPAIIGNLNDLQTPIGSHEAPRTVEVDGPLHEQPLEALRRVEPAADGDVVVMAGEDQFRLPQRLPAPPREHLLRVPRRRQAARPHVRAHQDLVAAHPRHVRLRLGQLERPIIDELQGFQVELADHRRIRPASGQMHQSPVVVRVPALRALPHPVLAFRRRQRIHVEQHLPLGRAGQERRQRRAPPQAARVVAVAPEVVQVLAAAHGIGDAGVGVEGGANVLLQRIAGRVAVEKRFRFRAALPRPVQRAAPGDVVEPLRNAVRRQEPGRARGFGADGSGGRVRGGGGGGVGKGKPHDPNLGHGVDPPGRTRRKAGRDARRSPSRARARRAGPRNRAGHPASSPTSACPRCPGPSGRRCPASPAWP